MLTKHRFQILLTAVFVFFLYFNSRLVASQVPCLLSINDSPENYENCNFKLASDTYLVYSVAGWTVCLVVLFMSLKTIKRFIFFAIIFTTLLISGYYIYLNSIEEKVINAPIYLDSFYQGSETPTP